MSLEQAKSVARQGAAAGSARAKQAVDDVHAPVRKVQTDTLQTNKFYRVANLTSSHLWLHVCVSSSTCTPLSVRLFTVFAGDYRVPRDMAG